MDKCTFNLHLITFCCVGRSRIWGDVCCCLTSSATILQQEAHPGEWTDNRWLQHGIFHLSACHQVLCGLLWLERHPGCLCLCGHAKCLALCSTQTIRQTLKAISRSRQAFEMHTVSKEIVSTWSASQTYLPPILPYIIHSQC